MLLDFPFMSFHFFKTLSSSIASQRFHHIDTAEFCFLNLAFYIFYCCYIDICLIFSNSLLMYRKHILLLNTRVYYYTYLVILLNSLV